MGGREALNTREQVNKTRSGAKNGEALKGLYRFLRSRRGLFAVAEGVKRDNTRQRYTRPFHSDPKKFIKIKGD